MNIEQNTLEIESSNREDAAVLHIPCYKQGFDSSKKDLLISFSGGRTSAMMTRWLLLNCKDIYNMTVVFANTGHEREATLDFVNKCDTEFGFNTIWIEPVVNNIKGKGNKAKIVNYNTAYRNRLKNGIDPFEAVIAKHGVPGINSPHCSRELKSYTIRAFAKSIGLKKYETAIGIRADEPERLNWEKAKKERLVYVLATMVKATAKDVNLFWSKQSFDLQLKSYQGNCILCWKKSDRKIWTIIKEGINDPEIIAEIEWLQMIDEKYGSFIPDGKKSNPLMIPPFRMFRKQRTILEMLEESNEETYSLAIDESKQTDRYIQTALWDERIDTNFGCTQSCEVF